MTRQGWAAKTVARKLGGQYISLSPKLTAELLRAEHKRAVRVVKRQLDLYQRQREVEKDERKRDLLAGSILACVDLLESLQRGRE